MFKSKGEKKPDLLSAALWVFLALSMDIIVHIILSNTMQNETFSRDIAGKSITTIIWLITIIIVIRYNKRNKIFSIKAIENGRKWLVTYAFIVLIMIVINLLLKGYGTVQLIHEFTMFTDKYESSGIIVFIIQIAYYLCEAALATFIIIFGQAWGEKKFENQMIPYGGVVMAITWGGIHFLSKDIVVGIYGIGMSLLIGVGYLVARKIPMYAYILALIIFVV